MDTSTPYQKRRMYHLLDFLELSQYLRRLSARSTPPMNALYNFTAAGHVIFFFDPSGKRRVTLVKAFSGAIVLISPTGCLSIHSMQWTFGMRASPLSSIAQAPIDSPRGVFLRLNTPLISSGTPFLLVRYQEEKKSSEIP